MTLADMKDKVIDLWDRLNPKVQLNWVPYSKLIFSLKHNAPEFNFKQNIKIILRYKVIRYSAL